MLDAVPLADRLDQADRTRDRGGGSLSSPNVSARWEEELRVGRALDLRVQRLHLMAGVAARNR
jgi:hypothetical protein